MTEITYELKHGLKYTNKGDVHEASFVTLTAPTFKQLDKVAPMKQALVCAITGLNTNGQEQIEGNSGPEGEVDAAQALFLLYNSSDNVTKVLLHGAELLKSGVALIEGEVKFTTPLLEKLELTDFEGLVGTYLANFILSSLMDGLK